MVELFISTYKPIDFFLIYFHANQICSNYNLAKIIYTMSKNESRSISPTNGF